MKKHRTFNDYGKRDQHKKVKDHDRIWKGAKYNPSFLPEDGQEEANFFHYRLTKSLKTDPLCHLFNLPVYYGKKVLNGNIYRAYSGPILHLTIECCPLLRRLCKALF